MMYGGHAVEISLWRAFCPLSQGPVMSLLALLSLRTRLLLLFAVTLAVLLLTAAASSLASCD